MKKTHLFLILILILGGFLRFYNLSWGNGYFFHPDENNMASSISQLSLNNKLNPNFFAYGQFPLYLTYFSYQVYSFIINIFRLPTTDYRLPAVPFGTAVFLLRFYSTLASTLTILLVYFIAKKFARPRLARLAALFTVFTPGLIQAAHFGTTESLLTFLFLLILYLSLKLSEKGEEAGRSSLAVLGAVCGIALASKLTAVYFLPTALLAIFINLRNQKAKFLAYFKQILLFTVCCLLFAIFFSPYNVIAFEKFRSALNYETAAAIGKTKVFYTRQFEQTTPFLFQMQKIFPYALGWPLFIIGSLGVIYLLHSLLLSIFSLNKNPKLKEAKNQNKSKDVKDQNKTKNKSFFPLNLNLALNFESLSSLNFILLFSFLVYFLPNALLFAKWSRFMAPIFPFFALFASYFISILLKLNQEKTASFEAAFRVGKGVYPLPSDTRRSFITRAIQFVKSLTRRAGDLHPNPKGSHRVSDGSATSAIHSPLVLIITIILVLLSMSSGILFFQIYTRPDSRLQASKWIYQNIPDNSYILSETANVVDIPVSSIKYQARLPNGQVSSIKNYQVVSFDFYHLDENPKLAEDLINHLEKADYILIPSRRIFGGMGQMLTGYPLVNRYYQALFDGRLGFEKVAEFSSFPKLEFGIWNLEFDDERSEETFTVFDHPVIRIYKKIKQYNKNDYQGLLTKKLHN